MRRVLVAALLVGLALPFGAARAQAEIDCFPFAPGCERLPRLLDELTRDLAPLLDDFVGRTDPFLGELRRLLGDLSGWHAPEILPNGDILIRRRRPSERPGDQRPTEPPEGTEDAPSVSEPIEL